MKLTNFVLLSYFEFYCYCYHQNKSSHALMWISASWLSSCAILSSFLLLCNRSFRTLQRADPFSSRSRQPGLQKSSFNDFERLLYLTLTSLLLTAVPFGCFCSFLSNSLITMLDSGVVDLLCWVLAIKFVFMRLGCVRGGRENVSPFVVDAIKVAIQINSPFWKLDKLSI